MPIGMQMKDALDSDSPQPKLVKVRDDEPQAIQQVKSLVPNMCHIDPRKRPSAASVADSLVTVLGE